MKMEMKNIVSFMIMMETLYRAEGVLTSKTNTTACLGLPAIIDFNINLQGSTFGTGSESWYFRSVRIATNPSGIFRPEDNYSSRLSSYPPYGISLTNVTSTDVGEYSLEFAVIAPVFEILTANALLTAINASSNSCVPYYSLKGNTATCFLNQTAVSNNECGSPILQTNWTHGSGTSDITTIEISGNYTCCAYGIAKNCYSGSYTFCETFSITVYTTTSAATTPTTTKTTLVTTSTTKGKTQTVVTTSENNGTDNDQLALIIGISVGVPIVLFIIIIIYCCKQRNKGRNSRKEQDANNHIKAKDATPNPPYGVLNASNEPYTSDVIQTIE